MLIVDPDCCSPDVSKVWEAEGFTVVSCASSKGLRELSNKLARVVAPDFFEDLEYDLKIKPRFVGGQMKISGGASVDPDFQEEGWVDFDDALLKIRQDRTDQDKVDDKFSKAVEVENKLQQQEDRKTEDLNKTLDQMRDFAFDLEEEE